MYADQNDVGEMGRNLMIQVGMAPRSHLRRWGQVHRAALERVPLSHKRRATYIG